MIKQSYLLKKFPAGRMNRNIFAIAISLALLSMFSPYAKPVPIQAAASNTAKTLIGCIRWDGQSGGDPWNVYNKEVQSLSPNEWHWRLPFYATEPTAESCTLNGNSQSIMDKEISYAKEAGIDYWAFVYYPASVNSGLLYAYDLYQASAHKNDIKWCVIIGGNYDGYFNLNLVDEYVSRFKQPNYLKVLGNRPVIYIFSFFTQSVADTVAALRTATKAEGLGDPYVVAMTGGNEDAVIGADAVSRYVTGGNGGVTYASVAEKERNSWETDKSKGKKVIPIVTSGWDPRPRMAVPGWGDYALPDSWYQTATIAEFANQLYSAIKWRDSNPSINEANSVLMYSWNEFAEGGQAICPLLIPGTSGGVNRSMLDAVKSVANGTFKTEKNYVKNATFCADGKPASIVSDWLKSSPNGTESAAKSEFANSAGYSGAFHLSHSSSSPYSVTTSQFISGLDDGAYTVIAMVKSSGGQSECNMQVTDYGGSDIRKDIQAASSWTPVAAHVNVSGGSCRISFNSVSPKGKWLMVGSVKMLAGNIPVSSPFSNTSSSYSSMAASSSKQQSSLQQSSGILSGSAQVSSSYSNQSSIAGSMEISSPASSLSITSDISETSAESSDASQQGSEGDTGNSGAFALTAAIILGVLILGGAGGFVYMRFFHKK